MSLKKIEKNRIFGLDIMRTFAILAVMFGHSIFFLPTSIKDQLHAFVIDGVNIFFVLSGFLIGGILIRDFEKKKTIKVLFNFWIRRWFRTLPNYFLILIILILLSNDTSKEYSYFSYFTFTENFFYPMPDFFPEAWSLSIEEWFYIIVPSSILLLSYIFKKSSLKSLFLYYSLSIIFIFVVIRLERYMHLEIPKGFRTWDLYFNRQVITRLDSLMFGVFAVFIEHYYPKVFFYKKKLLFALGLFIIVFSQYWIHNTHNFFIYTIYFSINSVGVVLLIPFLYKLKSCANNSICKFISYISLISYSLYLVNLSLVSGIIIPYINQYYSSPYFNIFLFWGISILISSVLYKYFEIPTTNLRDKIKAFKNDYR